MSGDGDALKGAESQYESTLGLPFDVVETWERVAGTEPDLLTRFRRRAERRRRRLNADRRVPFYRWEVELLDGRWAVVAMQNVAVPRG